MCVLWLFAGSVFGASIRPQFDVISVNAPFLLSVHSILVLTHTIMHTSSEVYSNALARLKCDHIRRRVSYIAFGISVLESEDNSMMI